MGRGKEITAAFRGLRDRERTLIPIGKFIAVDFSPGEFVREYRASRCSLGVVFRRVRKKREGEGESQIPDRFS